MELNGEALDETEVGVCRDDHDLDPDDAALEAVDTRWLEEISDDDWDEFLKLDDLSKFLRPYFRHRHLSWPDQQRLFAAYPKSEGDERRRIESALVYGNIGLVVKIARRYKSRGLPLVDLVQEGNLGLLKSLGKFDLSRGYKFSTYGAWWIRHAITTYIKNRTPGHAYRIPIHTQEGMSIVRKERARQAALNGEVPDAQALHRAVEAGRKKKAEERKFKSEPKPVPPEGEAGKKESKPRVISLKNVEEYLREISSGVTSTEDPVYSDSESATYGDLVSDRMAQPDVLVEAGEMLTRIKQEMRRIEEVMLRMDISERDREIVALRIGLRGERLSLREVGDRFGIVRERVRQITEKKLRNLAIHLGTRHEKIIALTEAVPWLEEILGRS